MLLRLAVNPQKPSPKTQLLEKLVITEGTTMKRTYRTSETAMLLMNHFDVVSILNREICIARSMRMLPTPPRSRVTKLQSPRSTLSVSPIVGFVVAVLFRDVEMLDTVMLSDIVTLTISAITLGITKSL